VVICVEVVVIVVVVVLVVVVVRVEVVDLVVVVVLAVVLQEILTMKTVKWFDFSQLFIFFYCCYNIYIIQYTKKFRASR